MIKVMFAVRAKPPLTRAQALHHLRVNHAPLVTASHTNRQRQRSYIQNHALDAPSVPGVTLDRDWIIESWRDETVILPEPPVAPDAILVREDEGRFPDRPTLLTLQVEEQPVWRADPDEPFAAAPFKVFTYYKRAPGLSPEAFDEAVARGSERLAAEPAFRREARGYLRNRTVPGEGPPVTATATPRAEKVPPFDAIDIFRFATADAIERLFADAGFQQALSRFEAEVADPATLFRLVTHENLVFDDARVDPASRRAA